MEWVVTPSLTCGNPLPERSVDELFVSLSPARWDAFLRKNGFNAVRVPLAVSAVLDRAPDAGCLPAPLAATVDDDLPAAEASIISHEHHERIQPWLQLTV